MRKINNYITQILSTIFLISSTSLVFAGDHKHHSGNYCMDIEIQPFHLMPDGNCTVRDYFDGKLQKEFFPFTEEDHLFNCEVFGPSIPMPFGAVPSSVTSGDAAVVGTIDGHPFEAKLMCASLTNWYQKFCQDPADPASCFQMAQPFMNMPQPFPRVTEISLFDGTITVTKNKRKSKNIPIVMVTRASGITHVEDLGLPLVGASFTHDLIGMATYETDEDETELKKLDGSADMLLQGHIFFPGSVSDDPGAARIKGTVCSKDLYKKLKGHSNKDDDD